MEELLRQMHEALGRELLRRIETGEATASDLSVCRQFLNDNHISGVPKKDNTLGMLSEKLAAFKDPDTIYKQ
jgi:hypothetical protein